MKPKVLKTDEEHAEALVRLRELMDAAPNTPEAEELELYALLIEEYEKRRWPIDLPDPIDAIEFRLDQLGLQRRDLIPYLGGASKVSEVMNRKRPLSLAMICKLHEGLGIPGDALLQQPAETLPPPQFDLAAFPIAEMYRRGYFAGQATGARDARAREEELLTALFAPFGGRPPAQVYCRHGAEEVNASALAAWQARALALAEPQDVARFDSEALDARFFAKVARASYHAEGPRLVSGLLARYGVRFVLLGHLPKTFLDGACFMNADGHPVVGMTLRFDRLDNFWFTLIHELAHVKLHLQSGGPGFFDDTEQGACPEDDPAERAADEFTRRTLITEEVWEREGPRLRAKANEEDVIALAETLEISPAIIAGRIRWETKDYGALSALVGSGQVRRLLSDLVKP